MNGKEKNIKDLARILGVSATTVSRVINGKSDKYRISKATTEKVLNAVREYNYVPNKIARGLRLDRTETLALIIPDINNPFFSSIAKIIEIESRKQGYSLILCDSLDNTDTEATLLNLLLSRKVDGIFLAPVGFSDQHLKDFIKRNTPIVIIDRYFPDIKIPYITSDNYAGAVEAVEHLVMAGHKTIACIQGTKGVSVNTDRINGYLDTLKKHNLPVDPTLITGDSFDVESGYIHTQILMNRSQPPTAIFALSNLISLGVVRALSEAGLSIPGDVSLVSFDDQPYSEFLATPMTTVDQPKDEIAKIAVSVLLDSIRNQKIDNTIRIMLKPKLIIRKSVVVNS